MGEYFPGEIRIGGKLSLHTAEKLVAVLEDEQLATSWGDAPLQDLSVAELQRIVAEGDHDGSNADEYLWLCNDQASYGMFEDLEAFLQENDIPYDRKSDAKYEFSAELTQWRPGMLHAETILLDAQGERVTPHENVEAIRRRLLEENTEAALLLIADILGEHIAPLPPFEVIIESTTNDRPLRALVIDD